MKFDANELYEIAIKVYREEDFLFEGERGYSQREGIGEWAYESAKENYINEQEVIDELKSHFKKEKTFFEK